MKTYLLRLLAALIDFIVLLPFFLLFALLSLFLSDRGALSLPLAALVFFLLSLLFAFALYSPLLMSRKKHNGQTLGKQTLSLRVEKKSEEPWSYSDALWRQFFALALPFVFLGWFFFFLPLIIDMLWPLGNRERQTLHDKIVGSRVRRDQ